MEKTILQWLNEIEEPEIREAAIEETKKYYSENSNVYNQKTNYKKLSVVLDYAFVFSKTKHGHNFWVTYQCKLIQQGK